MRSIQICILSLLGGLTTNACTTFFINHNGHMVFGRNYDWVSGEGLLCTNQRGLAKTPMKNDDGTTIDWVSHYGSITFNQYGKEFPTGGMNEAGLIVELMWLDGTVFPAPDNRPAIGVLQWIQYQLDNYATIGEVISSDKNLRIISNGTPLHYLIADANGNAATIEFIQGKMVVHKGKELPFAVLANSTYQQSLAARQNSNYRGNNSLERFTKVCNRMTQFQNNVSNKAITDQAFDILDEVAQGGFTKWKIVYDLTNKKIYFKTESAAKIKNIDFSSVDFSCNAKAKTIDMNVAVSGKISGHMSDFSTAQNRHTVETAFEQSKGRVQVNNAEKEAVIIYPGSISCK